MSKNLNTAQIVAAFRKWGVPYTVQGNPDTHHRPGPYGDMHGIVLHHTGTNVRDAVDLKACRFGRSDLAGPLSQFFTGDDCVVDIISSGRCSHAGKGARNTWDAVISENYTGQLWPGPDEIDFNKSFYGNEIGYPGTWMGDERYRVVLLSCAALCDAHGWSEKSVISHAELTKRKWDLGKDGKRMDMSVVRNDIRILLQHGPSGAKATVKTAKTPVVPAKPATAKPATVVSGLPADPGKAPHGPIAVSYLRRGQKPTWSVRRYKQVVLYAHGPSYRVAAVKRWGANLNSDQWDTCAEQMTEDLYRSLDKAYPGKGWGKGNLREPGKSLLEHLGFTVK